MEVKYLKKESDEAVLELDNLTVTEILRVYLNKDDKVSLAAWKREHPTKNPVLKIKCGKGRTPEKAIEMAASQIEKDTDKFLADFKKAK